jgi:parvulin-like peptidyl-prolyl isomerase
MDVGGVFQGGVCGGNVAKAGDQSISIAQFDRKLRIAAGRLGITPQQAYKLGYANEILGAEIQSHIMNKAASDLGVFIHEDYVFEQLQTILAPSVQAGLTPAQALDNLLRTQGMSEKALVKAIRMDATNALLISTLSEGFGEPSDKLAEDLYKFQNETRNIRYITFLDKDFVETKEPTLEDLQQFYELTKESYAVPEMRDIAVMTISTEKLAKTIDIPEQELQDYYDANIDSYSLPERRQIQQALISDGDKAQEIFESVKEGKSLQSAVEDLANPADYLGEDTLPEEALLDELKEPVFSAADTGILEPVETPLGYYIIDLKAVKDEEIKSFKDAKAEIRDILLQDRILDERYNLADAMDDLTASGATPQEVKEQMDITIERFEKINRFGQTPDNPKVLDRFKGGQADILNAAFELNQGEASPVIELSDGALLAVYVVNVTEKAYPSLEDLQVALKKKWIADQRKINNQVQTLAYMTEIQSGATSFDETAQTLRRPIKSKEKIAKTATDITPLSPQSVTQIFAAPLKEPFLMTVEGGLAIAEVTGFNWPDDAPEKGLETVFNDVQKQQRDEVLGAYLKDKTDKYGAQINQALLERIYGAQDQQQF